MVFGSPKPAGNLSEQIVYEEIQTRLPANEKIEVLMRITLRKRNGNTNVKEGAFVTFHKMTVGKEYFREESLIDYCLALDQTKLLDRQRPMLDLVLEGKYSLVQPVIHYKWYDTQALEFRDNFLKVDTPYARQNCSANPPPVARRDGAYMVTWMLDLSYRIETVETFVEPNLKRFADSIQKLVSATKEASVATQISNVAHIANYATTYFLALLETPLSRSSSDG